MSIRKFFVEYRSEVVFGLALTAATALSYILAPLIPIDLFRKIIYPVQNTAIITVLLINT